jgi:hypothetical protein
MLERWLESIPRPILIVGGLVIGLIYIVVFLQPPRTVCDSQFDVIHANLTPTVYFDPAKPYNRKGNIFVALKECRGTNSPGGCLDLFDALRRILKETEHSSNDCSLTLAKDETLLAAFNGARDLIVDIAWGTQPPQPAVKNNWLDLENVDVFCRTVHVMRTIYGKDDWVGYVDIKLSSLPGSSTFARGEAWKRTIMSSCGR